MLTLAGDENLKEQIVSGLRRRLPGVDLVTVRKAGLEGSQDPLVLAWAAEQGRVVVTHDTRTMGDYAYERVASGEPMPGVVEIPDLMPVGQAIHELAFVVQLMDPSEIRDRVLRLPL